MSDVLLAIGTRKGLFLARGRDDRTQWRLDGPHLRSNAVYAIAVDTRRDPVRLLAGAHSEHWGPTVFRSDDLGRSWQETEGGAVRFPIESGGALQRVWQLHPGRADQPDVVWAGGEPGSLFRSDDAGETFALVDGLWNHPHRPKWEPGGGGQCLHSILPHPSDPDRLLVALSTGGVYRTEDGGATWEASNRGIGASHPTRAPARVRAVRPQDHRSARPARAGVPAEPRGRVPQRRRWRVMGADRRGAARGLRVPHRRSPSPSGHRVRLPARERRAPNPARRSGAASTARRMPAPRGNRPPRVCPRNTPISPCCATP